MYIYADVVLLINLLMNTLILLCTAWAAGVHFKFWRLCVAAIIGSFYALGEVIPVFALFYHPIAKVVFSVILVFIAYGMTSVKKLVLRIGIFYLVSFILGGAVIGWMFFSQTEGAGLNKPISWTVLAGGSLVAIGIMLMVAKFITNNLSRKKLLYKVTIELFDCCVHLQGLLDTGNNLYSLVGRKPVILVNYSAIKKVLSAEVINYLDTMPPEMWLNCLDKCEDQQWLSRVQIIPYRGVGSQSMLLGFRPDKLCVAVDNTLISSDAIVGLYTGQLSLTNNYEVLLHPKVLEHKIDGEANICA